MAVPAFQAIHAGCGLGHHCPLSHVVAQRIHIGIHVLFAAATDMGGITLGLASGLSNNLYIAVSGSGDNLRLIVITTAAVAAVDTVFRAGCRIFRHPFPQFMTQRFPIIRLKHIAAEASVRSKARLRAGNLGHHGFVLMADGIHIGIDVAVAAIPAGMGGIALRYAAWGRYHIGIVMGCFRGVIGLIAVAAASTGAGGVAPGCTGRIGDLVNEAIVGAAVNTVFPNTQIQLACYKAAGCIAQEVKIKIFSGHPIAGFTHMIHRAAVMAFGIMVIHGNPIDQNISRVGLRKGQINHIAAIGIDPVFQTEGIGLVGRISVQIRKLESVVIIVIAINLMIKITADKEQLTSRILNQHGLRDRIRVPERCQRNSLITGYIILKHPGLVMQQANGIIQFVVIYRYP